MICADCKTQFKSDTPIEEKKSMYGLCQKCGKELRHKALLEGFGGAGLTVLVASGLFIIVFSSWVNVAFVVVAFGSLYALLYYFVKSNGYVVYETTEQRNKARLPLGLVGGVMGFLAMFFIAIISFNV